MAAKASTPSTTPKLSVQMSPKLAAKLSPELTTSLPPLVSLDNMPSLVTAEEAVAKRRKFLPRDSLLHDNPTLKETLTRFLPDKVPFIDDWMKALADPSVCITNIGDVQRLNLVDIASLPIPPLVKGVLRQVLERRESRLREEQAVVEASKLRTRSFLEKQKDRNMQPRVEGSKYFQDQKNYRLILTKEELEAGVRIVARRIENWSKGERVVLVGILKGAFMFMSDLCRVLTRPYSVYFVEASSYTANNVQGNVTVSSNVAKEKFCDSTTQKPHKVVIIDELLDNGKTMHEMRQHILGSLAGTHSENDILTCCLLSKQRERVYAEADITGIPDLPDLWLVGYGLDDRGTKRGWDNIFAIPKVKIIESFEQKEVDKLVEHLDSNATLTHTIAFEGVELTASHKQKHRVFSLDVLSGHAETEDESRVTRKDDILKVLKGVQVVKGKFEHELQFAFIMEGGTQGTQITKEDAIFSGNNTVFAEMRCRLRACIAKEAQRFNVDGPGEV